MRRARFHPGDLVILLRTQHGSEPGPAAKGIAPSRGGDLYSYVVETYAIVVEVTDDDELVLESKSGDRFRVRHDDLNVRRAGFWDRWRHHDRFPHTFDPKSA